MKRMPRMKQVLLATMVAALLGVSGLALAGCGGGDNKSDDNKATETTQTDNKSDEKSNTGSSDDNKSSESSDSSESSKSSDSSEEKSSSSEYTLKDVEDSLVEAYMGTTDSGEGFYYASSENGELAIVAALNEDGESVSFVGPATVDGNQVTIEDIQNGMSLTFSVEPQDDGTVVLDMGDTGKATIAECEVSEVTDALSKIDQYSKAVA